MWSPREEPEAHAFDLHFIFRLPCVGGTRRLDASKDRFVNFSPHIERQQRAANCSGWMLFGKVSVRNCQNMPRFIEGHAVSELRGVGPCVGFFFFFFRLSRGRALLFGIYLLLF